MNTAKLKKYAPQARREFISAVSKQLNQLGIYSDKQISDVKEQGSVLSIEGKAFPISIKTARERLVRKIKTFGYAQLIEQVAYTWFNRLCAIRYMEIHDYLGHGFRVLSHPDNPKGFEIIDHAQDAADELGLDRARIIELKLAGNKDEELYRELLLGQCHKLHEAMPFLFDALDDETELLLPDNLTRTDSILRGLVDGIPEEDWQQVEVIGWLYQFYISEKKDQVMGKVVKSEDIPAATQLFTPNWIVKYLVQNSVGRQWLQTYPDSAIKTQMEYYIEPAEQSDEVNQQLKAITPESIEPETIKVLDPACGSGHILIEAYNVLKAIYEERGFRSRDIPKMILENNLYGLDIDDRAAQLSGFALMMMARDDDKRIFTRNVRLNVLSLQESSHIDLPTLWKALNLSGSWQSGTSQGLFADEEQDLSSFNADNRYQLLKRTFARFTQAKTFGSLIDVPSDDHDQLQELLSTLVELQESGDSMQKPAAKQLIEFVHQALVLSIRYDAVIANPPYMGSNFLVPELKTFISNEFNSAKSDLYSAFMLKAKKTLSKFGRLAYVTMHTWMYLSNFNQFRRELLNDCDIENLLHLQNGVMGIAFQTSAAVFCKSRIKEFIGTYGVIDKENVVDINRELQGNIYTKDLAFFENLPNNEIAFTLKDAQLNFFKTHPYLQDFLVAREGMTTADNEKFLRYWWEVDNRKISTVDSVNSKWFPYQKGGPSVKWFGNNEWVVNWANDGEEIKNNVDLKSGRVRSHNYNGEYALQSGITWSSFSNGGLAFRYVEEGFLFDTTGSMAFARENLLAILGYLNSQAAQSFFKSYSPTPRIKIESLLSLPFVLSKEDVSSLSNSTRSAIEVARTLYSTAETSPSFNLTIKDISNGWGCYNSFIEEQARKLYESEVNIELIVSNALKVESVCTNSISATLNICSLLSFSIGCMVGRFSLDRNGLIHANSNNEDFDLIVQKDYYGRFPADEDGIIPLTDQEWFKDDATNRFREFVQVVWGEEHLQENLDFVAESLCLNAIKPKKSESALETIRRYLSTQFYKDHLKTYKKRPIYWLFSSGKQKAFECLVYLHRYNDGTLSRMRTEYITPLLGKYDAYAEQLEKQIETADSTSEANRFKKELDALIKKQVELREFDDKLKHYADMRISLDLDDGVKVNYGKFGDLLADVKAITGSAPEDN